MVTTQLLFGAVSKTVCEIDGASQNGRPITFGMNFADGDITAGQFPQPQISGQSIVTWQYDAKNAYASTSPQFGIVSFVIPTMAANTCYTVTFASNANTCSSCTGGTPAGFLTAATMASFNSGNWDSQIVVTPKATSGSNIGAVTVSAKTMLAASDPGSNTFGDCKNDYWLKGPVVTAVIVQDCNTTSAGTYAGAYDLGWKWDGTNMTTDAGTPHVGNLSNNGTSKYASIHPSFELRFYPSVSSVESDAVAEITSTTRYQDQLVDLTFKTGDASGTLQTHWTRNCARVKTDVTYSNGSPTIGSISGFTSADIGCPIQIDPNDLADPYDWYTIIGIPDATHATLNTNCCQNGPSGSVAYMGPLSGGQRPHKTFWSGTASGQDPKGHIRINNNLAQLIKAKAFPCFDNVAGSGCTDTGQTITANPEYENESGKNGATAWSTWITRDKGEIGGFGGFGDWTQGYANDSQGAAIQREEVEKLYTCDSNNAADGKGAGDANSLCAKAQQMLDGSNGLNDTTLTSGCTVTIAGSPVACKDSGGVGVYYNVANVPVHFRETQAASTGQFTGANAFYCVNADPLQSSPGAHTGKNADPFNTTTCGTSDAAPNNAQGKAWSPYAHSDQRYSDGNPPVAKVGTAATSPGGWQVGACDHMLYWYYMPYIETGHYYHLEENYMLGSFCDSSGGQPDQGAYGGNGFFGIMNPQEWIARKYAFGQQAVGYAALVAPDGTPEKSLYNSVAASNLEFMEGFLGVTGTVLTPTDTSCSVTATCNTYDYTKANRWNWASASVRSGCASGSTWYSNPGACTVIPNTLHFVESAQAPTTGQDGNPDPAANFAIATRIVLTGGNGDAQAYIKTITGGVIQNDAVVPVGYGGTGYSVAPTCAITSTAFSGDGTATCTASVAGGAVTGITITNGGHSYINATSAMGIEWMQHAVAMTTSIMRDAGLTYFAGVSTQGIASINEKILDSTYNHFLLNQGTRPSRVNGILPYSFVFGQNANPYPANYAAFANMHTGNNGSVSTLTISGITCVSQQAVATTTSAVPWASGIEIQIAGSSVSGFNANWTGASVSGSTLTFNTWPGACPAASSSGGTAKAIAIDTYDFDQRVGGSFQSDHPYAGYARMAQSFGQAFSVTSSDANCPAGTCTSSAAWTWILANMPYFGITPASSPAYAHFWGAGALGDLLIKQTVVPRSSGVASSGSIQTQNTIRKAGTVMQ